MRNRLADDTVTDMERADFQEVLHRFERWRAIATMLGQKPYDEPDFDNGRLYFRSDYAEQVAKWPDAREKGDWGAYVIESTATGLFSVVRSLWHERAPERSEDLEVMFSRPDDAGKYVIAHVANSIRFGTGLKSRSISWRELGLDRSIVISPPTDEQFRLYFEAIPGADPVELRGYLNQYTVEGASQIYAVTSSENRPYMQVLARSFDQLDAELLKGLPIASAPAS